MRPSVTQYQSRPWRLKLTMVMRPGHLETLTKTKAVWRRFYQKDRRESDATIKNIDDYKEFQDEVAKVIIRWPLYRKYVFNGDLRTPWSTNNVHFLVLPVVIVMDCRQCGHLQPWDIKTPREGVAEHGLVRVQYSCRACGFTVHYWLLLAYDSSGGTLLKVGQYPPLEHEPPPLVAAGMDAGDLTLYRRALTCRNYNFGIGAVAYLRRIVENRTNYLIDLIAARTQAEDPDSPLLKQVDDVKKDRRFSEKIDFARDLLPKSIRIGGHNPISLLHDLTSEALHSLSDEESVDIFDRCQLAFEHVIKRLKQDEDEDQSFRDAMKKLTERTAKNNP